MSTQTIPRDQWVAFFDHFSEEHQGWLSKIEILGIDVGAQTESSEQPLMGITADLKDGEESIAIFVGDQLDHLTHLVQQPAQVDLMKDEPGAPGALQIRSREGATTLLRFRSPALLSAGELR